MKKWNLYGWIAAVALSGVLFLTGLPGEAKAQEVCETELEHEIQEQTQLEEQTEAETPEQTQSEEQTEAETPEQTQSEEQTEAETQEQTQSEEQTEAETQEQTQSEMQTETEAQEYMQYETETGLELLASQETTEAVPDNYFEDFTSATAYLREQMAQHQTDIEVVVVLDHELSEDELTARAETILKEAMAQTGSSREGDAISSDFLGAEYSVDEVTDGAYFGCFFDYTVTYKTNSQQERELELAVINKMIELCAGTPSDYEIVRQIYDYICSTVTLDTTSTDENVIAYSAYAAMQHHRATSEGYAALFYRMCQQAGISARIVSGTVNGEANEWNIVNINGSWYNVDCAMDAYENPLTRNYQWFLKSDADFSNHVADDAWWNPTGAFYVRSEASYDVPETDRCFVGLAYVDGIWHYYRNGGHAGFIRRGNQNEMAAPLLERGTHDHRAVHKEELFPRLPGFHHGKIQPMVDFRLGDGGQPSGALRCSKGTVRQQAAAHLTGFIHNIGTEFLLELHNAGRTRQQNFPRHLVGIHTAEPRGTDAVRQGGFAAAGTPGNANDLHIRPPPRGTPRHGSSGYTRPWKRHR